MVFIPRESRYWREVVIPTAERSRTGSPVSDLGSRVRVVGYG